MWDADVSNNGFRQNKGLALYVGNISKDEPFTTETKEEPWDAAKRQRLYENLTTEDDHLMHIVGTEKAKDGKLFFIVKNSWGKVGPYDGYINVSESYFAINTVSLVVPKAALSKELIEKLKL
jgi:bleomycin hydrolase